MRHEFSHDARAVRVRGRNIVSCIAMAFVLATGLGAAQGMTGALFVTVEDTTGGVFPGAIIRIRSTALIGGPMAATTNEKGQVRDPALPPGQRLLCPPPAGEPS